MQEFNFVTDGSVVYRIGGNDWFAVSQDDETVLLVDTDAALPRADGTLVGLESEWSDGKWNTIGGENGQTLLDYTNKLVDKYLGKIKYAMKPTNVACDYKEYVFFSEPKNLKGNINEAYMFPLSYDELDSCRAIGGKIFKNSRENYDKLKNEIGDNISNSFVWTRTFGGISSSGNRCAWFVSNSGGGLSYSGGVCNAFRVAPAFNLKKSSIIRINPDGEIILKPADTDKDNEKEDKREEIKVPVKGGYLVAGRNEDPNYDGIYIAFQSYDGIMIDLVNVETPNSEHKNSISMYSFEDINSEDYTRKAIFSLSEILKKLE